MQAKARTLTVCMLLAVVLSANAARVPALEREMKVTLPAEGLAEFKTEDGKVLLARRVTESDTTDTHPLCDVCVQFATENLGNLAKNLEAEGVKGSCLSTCSLPGALDKKVCDLLCKATGPSSFADAVQKSNSDANAACQLFQKDDLPMCPSKADDASDKAETKAEAKSEAVEEASEEEVKEEKEAPEEEKEEEKKAAEEEDVKEEKQTVYASIREHFAAWMKEFEKTYETKEEHEKRLEIFKANKAFVEKHNKEHAEGKHGHWVGLNHLADLTSDEYKQLLGYKSTLLNAKPPVDPATWEYAHVKAHEKVDWVANGAVTGVKNQGQCGSCWAFSTTGAVEGANFVATGKLVSVSEQELVSCSHNGNMGCNGGLMDNGFQWIVTNKGIDTEKGYKYVSGAGVVPKCNVKKEHKHIVSIDGFKDVPPNNEKELEKAVTMQPVAVAIEADHQSFQLYKGGVFNAKDCGTALDHGVLVVGYGFDAKSKGHKHFWKIKNSWGPAWGEDGFIRIAKGGGAAAGQCGVAVQPSYATKAAAASEEKEQEQPAVAEM